MRNDRVLFLLSSALVLLFMAQVALDVFTIDANLSSLKEARRELSKFKDKAAHLEAELASARLRCKTVEAP